MAKPIVYGTIVSPPVRSVLLTASALNLEIDFKEVSLTKKQHLTEEYLKKNPQHTVPTLDDNGKIAWDSHAIATYLIGKYGKNDELYPKDLYLRARIDQRLHFDTGVLFPILREIIHELVYMKQPELSERTKGKIIEGYDFLNTFLASEPYLVGNSLTVADLCCLSTVTTLNIFIPIDATKFPKLSQWVDKLTKLPYYNTANKPGIDAFARAVGQKAAEGKA
ncbi:unnamed protein product [Hermetia illucens]|uniref:Uncharacterized protein n=1 Tax=Hermetia illucens TaxID=343691 RepID=A0A7R8YRV2_HERIL|nr:glutathione S-transferase 1-like [Hermetia illucens]CAD7083103.1 unnamed protein product [Hermetia illucens]